MDFDKIVQRMKKKWQKLWSLADIEGSHESNRSDVKKGAAYKLVHRLVSTGVLVSIRKGMYLWNMGEKLDPEDFYWPILKKVIAENYLGQGIITGSKALAFSLRDYSLPETMQIVTQKDAAKLALLGDYRLVSQVVRGEKKSLYPLIKKYSTRLTIEWVVKRNRSKIANEERNSQFRFRMTAIGTQLAGLSRWEAGSRSEHRDKIHI